MSNPRPAIGRTSPDNSGTRSPTYDMIAREKVCVDDRAIEGGLQSDARMDVVGALAKLEARMLAPLPQPHTP